MRIFDGIVARMNLKGTAAGLLSGKTFVAKDLFEIEGYTACAGVPDWQKTHEKAKDTASSVKQLLKAGADLVGMSCTDQLAFSLDGINSAYGIPQNPNYPGHIPGGSSSGSASAVASGICDFAIGTDTLGSVRVPSAYCGIIGMRPSHGAISTQGVIPLGQSFDTVGWFAREFELFKTVGETLLPEEECNRQNKGKTSLKVVFVADYMELLCQELKLPWQESAFQLLGLNRVETVRLPEKSFDDWIELMNKIRGFEAWQNHGEWITRAKPEMDDAIKSRFLACSNFTETEYLESKEKRLSVMAELSAKLQNCLFCVPTVWNWPPSCQSSQSELEENRKRNLKLNIAASIGGLPQINLPVKLKGHLPKFGLSLIAARGQDRILLDHVSELLEAEN